MSDPPAAVDADPDAALIDMMSEFYHNPLGWVKFAFPWGTGELNGWDGPDLWQQEFLRDVGREVRKRAFNGVDPVEPLRFATASGHGIGKSALVSWLILWIMSTRPWCKGTVTANTSLQLETKTWAELAKWKQRCVVGHWFKINYLEIVHVENPKRWRVDAATCREENSEAFAGQHAADSTPFYIFDEASNVPAVIWKVAEGGLTDGEPMFFAFGNPTRNSGEFFACFGAMRHRWNTRQIDSRTARMPNKRQIQEWVDDYGEDSDFVRVRVRGIFPRAGSTQFISNEAVDGAMDPARDADVGIYDPLVLGIDVARFGDDQTVFVLRRGLDCRLFPVQKFRGLDTMQVAARAAEVYHKHKPDAIFVDQGTFGAGVVDRLRQLGINVVGVDFGGKPDGDMLQNAGSIAYYNKRAEMWGRMRDWLLNGMLPEDNELKADLTGVEYGYVLREGRDSLLLEKKEDMKKRGLASPDVADALALTFAHPVAPQDQSWKFGRHTGAQAHSWDYNPFDSEHGGRRR